MRTLIVMATSLKPLVLDYRPDESLLQQPFLRPMPVSGPAALLTSIGKQAERGDQDVPVERDGDPAPPRTAGREGPPGEAASRRARPWGLRLRRGRPRADQSRRGHHEEHLPKGGGV